MLLVLLAVVFVSFVQELPFLGGNGVQHLRKRVLHSQRDGGDRRPSTVSSVHTHHNVFSSQVGCFRFASL